MNLLFYGLDWIVSNDSYEILDLFFWMCCFLWLLVDFPFCQCFWTHTYTHSVTYTHLHTHLSLQTFCARSSLSLFKLWTFNFHRLFLLLKIISIYYLYKIMDVFWHFHICAQCSSFMNFGKILTISSSILFLVLQSFPYIWIAHEQAWCCVPASVQWFSLLLMFFCW